MVYLPFADPSLLEVSGMNVQTFVTILCAAIASSGLWSFIIKIVDKKDVRTQMLIGLGHDRIICLGMQYIERGEITQSEYENLHKYLYEPYKKMGGNGSADRIMKEIDKLRIVPDNYERKEAVTA